MGKATQLYQTKHRILFELNSNPTASKRQKRNHTQDGNAHAQTGNAPLLPLRSSHNPKLPDIHSKIRRSRSTSSSTEASWSFRGGLFGFLLGSTLAGAGVYYYVLDEYKVSNGLLSEDIYSLQASVQRVHSYVQTLEEKLVELEKKK